MDNREKIKEIIIDYNFEILTFDEAVDKILLLFNVSGNEANPKDNKKDGEVALPSVVKCDECLGELDESGRCWCYDGARQ